MVKLFFEHKFEDTIIDLVFFMPDLDLRRAVSKSLVQESIISVTSSDEVDEVMFCVLSSAYCP